MLDGKLYEDISSIFKSKNIHEFCKLTGFLCNAKWKPRSNLKFQ